MWIVSQSSCFKKEIWEAESVGNCNLLGICHSLWPLSSWTSSYIQEKSPPPAAEIEKSAIHFPSLLAAGTLAHDLCQSLCSSSSPTSNQKVMWRSKVMQVPSSWGQGLWKWLRPVCRGSDSGGSPGKVSHTSCGFSAQHRRQQCLHETIPAVCFWLHGLQTWFSSLPVDSVSCLVFFK